MTKIDRTVVSNTVRKWGLKKLEIAQTANRCLSGGQWADCNIAVFCIINTHTSLMKK